MRTRISTLNHLVIKEIKRLRFENDYKVKKDPHGVLLTKDEGNFISRVCFVLNRPFDDVEALGFCLFIGHPEVENIIDPILKKNRLKGESGDFITTFSTPYRPKYRIKEIIKTPNDLLPIIEKFKLFFIEDALPYFEKWKDLRTVSEFLNDIPQMEVHKYMSKGIYKKAVIWKLCKNPRYEEYMDWLYNGLRDRHQKNPNGDINYKRTADAITELKEILDKTAPIYQ